MKIDTVPDIIHGMIQIHQALILGIPAHNVTSTVDHCPLGNAETIEHLTCFIFIIMCTYTNVLTSSDIFKCLKT